MSDPRSSGKGAITTILAGHRVEVRDGEHLAGARGLVTDTYLNGSVEVTLDSGSSYFVCHNVPSGRRVEDVLRVVTEPPHLIECTGNGSESYWDCGAEGFYCVPTDDDPSGDEEHVCETCDGSGYVRCLGCAAQDAAGPSQQESTR